MLSFYCLFSPRVGEDKTHDYIDTTNVQVFTCVMFTWEARQSCSSSRSTVRTAVVGNLEISRASRIDNKAWFDDSVTCITWTATQYCLVSVFCFFLGGRSQVKKNPFTEGSYRERKPPFRVDRPKDFFSQQDSFLDCTYTLLLLCEVTVFLRWYASLMDLLLCLKLDV